MPDELNIVTGILSNFQILETGLKHRGDSLARGTWKLSNFQILKTGLKRHKFLMIAERL